MAQTKRRRRTKHKGNAAGVVEVRGRTGRPPKGSEKKPAGGGRGDARANRYDTPPTWPGAINRALMVDPGDEAERLLAAVDELGVTLEAILLTHTHFDHVGAVAPVAKATGAPVYCPKLEVPVLADIMRFVPWPGIGPFESYDA